MKKIALFFKYIFVFLVVPCILADAVNTVSDVNELDERITELR